MIRIRDPHERLYYSAIHTSYDARSRLAIGKERPNRNEAKRNEIRRLNRIRRNTRIILIHIRLSIRWRRSIFRHSFFRMMFRTVDSPLSFAIFLSDQANFRMFFFFDLLNFLRAFIVKSRERIMQNILQNIYFRK